MKSGDSVIFEDEKPYQDMGNRYTMPWYKRVVLIWTDNQSYIVELPNGTRKLTDRKHLFTDEEYKILYAANQHRGWREWLIMPRSKTVDGITLLE